jgi:hypothetical protein
MMNATSKATKAKAAALAWTILTAGGLIVTGTPASAATQFRVAWTGIGVYPRSGPSMDTTKVGAALPDGAIVDVDCETTGTTMTDTAGYVSDIWERLTDGTYIANVFVNTGVDGWTPGIPVCADPGIQYPTLDQQVPKPSGGISAPWPDRPPFDPPRERFARTDFVPEDDDLVRAACNFQSLVGWDVAASMCRHYVDATGTEYNINMGDLVWNERPLWGALEWWLRDRVTQTYAAALSTPASGSAMYTFDSGWRAYEAPEGDWQQALHGFQFRVFGDLWVGPANSAGVRPVQVRYRSQMGDVYNFNENDWKQYPFYNDASLGWAAEFWVSGETNSRIYETDSVSIQLGSLPFEW